MAQTFRAPPGASQPKSRDLPAKSLVSLGFEGHTELFGPDPFTSKEDIRTKNQGRKKHGNEKRMVMFGAKFGRTFWPFLPRNPTFLCTVPSKILRNCSRELSLEHCHCHAFFLSLKKVWVWVPFSCLRRREERSYTLLKITLTTPTPHICKKYAPKICHTTGVCMAYKSVKIKGFLQKVWHTDPKIWHTKPPFYAICTVFIGGGGGL